MSIFLSQTSSKPSSYTQEFKPIQTHLDYNVLKKEVRNNVHERFRDFDKVSLKENVDRPSTSRPSPQRSNSSTGLSFQSIYSSKQGSTKETLFAFQQKKSTVNGSQQSSPMKISGLQKSLSSLGLKQSNIRTSASISGNFGHFNDLNHAHQSSDFASGFLKTQPSSQYNSSKVNSSTSEFKTTGTSFLGQTNKYHAPSHANKYHQPSQQISLSQLVSVQKLVEIQNLLELTPQHELAELPRHYLDELLRVAQAITRTLRYHHDQQRFKA